MNPLISQLVGSLIRHGLTALSGYLGLQGETPEAVVVFLVALAWAAYEKVRRQPAA
jgi:hypothetical protein